MSILDAYRPRSLSAIVGQPCTRLLAAYAADPNRPSRCYLMEGDGGIGKTATAHALAAELGATETAFGGGYLEVIPASELRIEQCNDLFKRVLRLSFAWKVIIIEELDGLPSKAVERFLKVSLEERALPPKTTVIATSNGAGGLDSAFLQRFRLLRFGNGPHFAAACHDELGRIWTAETGEDCLPAGWITWGATSEGFSMRRALQAMEDALAMRECEVAV